MELPELILTPPETPGTSHSSPKRWSRRGSDVEEQLSHSHSQSQLVDELHKAAGLDGATQPPNFEPSELPSTPLAIARRQLVNARERERSSQYGSTTSGRRMPAHPPILPDLSFTSLRGTSGKMHELAKLAWQTMTSAHVAERCRAVQVDCPRIHARARGECVFGLGQCSHAILR